jgi:hypothetical protein
MTDHQASKRNATAIAVALALMAIVLVVLTYRAEVHAEWHNQHPYRAVSPSVPVPDHMLQDAEIDPTFHAALHKHGAPHVHEDAKP